jgi:hypothetical protein
MAPLGTRSKYDIASTSRKEVARRAKAGRSRARQAARKAVKAAVAEG